MDFEPKTWREHVAAISEHTNALRNSKVPPEDVPDLSAALRSIEAALGKWRLDLERDTLAEQERLNDEAGDYKTEVVVTADSGHAVAGRRPIVYTYGTARILFDTAEALQDESVVGALMHLEKAGALSFAWKVKALRTTLEKLGVDLVEVKGKTATAEPDDLEAPHIAGRRSDKMTVVRS